ncbi:MAG: hypothetical protein JXR97_06945, partial [Planctomycetes bacterium]|nr:hypothetical protein [Planctomycetota bacterium]
MSIELGPRDEERFADIEESLREYLIFLVDFSMGVLEKRPNQIEALENAANALTTLGYYEDGLRCDQRLSSLRPENATVVYNLACSQALVGDLEAALLTLDRAINLGYLDAGHMKNDPDLANLWSHPRFGELSDK